MRPRLFVVVTHGLSARYLLRGQLAFLRERGFEVTLAAAPGPLLDEAAAAEGVSACPLPMARQASPLQDFAALLRLAGVMRRERPHLLNASTPKAGLLGSLAGRLAGVPVRVYLLRGLRLETSAGAARALLAASERLAAASAQTVVCVSESLRRKALELRLAPASKLEVLGPGSSNGVDLERFRPADRVAREAARAAFGLPAEAVVIGFVGRLVGDKGIGDLATAFLDQVAPRLPEARLLLAGDYERGDAVGDEIRHRLAASPAVRLAGFVRDPATLFPALDLVAFPSRREGFPNVPLEAAAAGVPTVGYAATGTVDAVVDGETGLLVPVGDRLRLGSVLLALATDAERRGKLAHAARRRAERDFGCEVVWRRWLEFYRARLAARGLPLPAGAGAER